MHAFSTVTDWQDLTRVSSDIDFWQLSYYALGNTSLCFEGIVVWAEDEEIGPLWEKKDHPVSVVFISCSWYI